VLRFLKEQVRRGKVWMEREISDLIAAADWEYSKQQRRICTSNQSSGGFAILRNFHSFKCSEFPFKEFIVKP
jgi:hypothetical protein